MYLKQIETFVKVYELLNFSRAAEQLYLTQSAVSQSIQKMEEELGEALFSRHNKKITATEAGHAFYPHACVMMEAYRKALAEMRSSSNEVTVSYLLNFDKSLMNRLLSCVLAQYPELMLSNDYRKLSELKDQNTWKEKVLYLVPEDFIHSPAVQKVFVASSPHILLIRKDNPLCEKEVVKPSDLGGQMIYTPASDPQVSHMRQALQLLREEKIPCQEVVSPGVFQTCARIMALGGVAIFPDYFKENHPDLISRPFDDGISSAIYLAYIGEPTPGMKKFIRAVKQAGAVTA